MKHIVLAFLFLISCIPAALADASLSETRLEKLQKLALDYAKEHPETSASDIAKAIQAKLGTVDPTLAKAPTVAIISENDAIAAFETYFPQAVARRFPDPSPTDIEKACAEKYPLYKIGDKVTVRYNQGIYVRSYAGRIFEIGKAYVKVGPRKIMYAEMEAAGDNQEEILKFLPEETQKLRDAYTETYKEEIRQKREDFRRNGQQQVRMEMLENAVATNEKNGYTLCEQRWLSPEQLAEYAAELAIQTRDKALIERLSAKFKDRTDVLLAQSTTLREHDRMMPPGHLDSKEFVQRKQHTEQLQRVAVEQRRQKAIAERKKQEEIRLAKLREEDEAQKRILAERKAKLEADAKAAKEREEALLRKQKEDEERERKELEEAALQEKLAEEKQQAEERERNSKVQAQRTEQRKRQSRVMAIIFGIIAVLGIIGSGIWFLSFRGKKEITKSRKNPYGSFFAAKGKLQEQFWESVEKDPEHFKYVAYMFPTIEKAQNALAQLSFFSIDATGNLHCAQDLQFGTYKHRGRAICFVGGTNLTYALWREATGVLPELPEAEYFKVSTEPKVQLILPQIQEKTSNEIVFEGVQDSRGPNGEFLQIYTYKADSLEHAETFLGEFEVTEAGIIVYIQTPEGLLAKDKDGVYNPEVSEEELAEDAT